MERLGAVLEPSWSRLGAAAAFDAAAAAAAAALWLLASFLRSVGVFLPLPALFVCLSSFEPVH